MGDSAFVENEAVFLPVDVDGERESLQEQGQQTGGKNFPSSDALHPGDVEHGIVQRITQTSEQTQARLSQHFDGFRQRLLPIVQTWNATASTHKIQAMTNQLENALNHLLHQFKDKSAVLGPRWRHAQDEHKNFRERNRLVRPADYSSLGKVIFCLCILCIIESILNASLLWELTGFLLALGQTLLITSVNVLIGASMMGLCLRYKNHVSPNVRWRAWICIPVILAVLVFNVGVGHYRDAIVEAQVQAEQFLAKSDWDNSTEPVGLGFGDYTQKAMENIMDSFLGIDSILSALLIIGGLGFFGFAAYKWYSMWDAYPGYRKCDIALIKVHQDYTNLVSTTRNHLERKNDDALKQVADERTKVTNMQEQYNELINRAETLRQSYANWCVVLGQTQTTLLEIYRSANRQARSEPAPEYFNDTIPIDDRLIEPPNFEPLELGDVNAVVDEVRLAEGEIKRIADKIRKEFNILANRQNQTDTPIASP